MSRSEQDNITSLRFSARSVHLNMGADAMVIWDLTWADPGLLNQVKEKLQNSIEKRNDNLENIKAHYKRKA